VLIELTTFNLADGTDEAAFVEADRAVQAELSCREGFVRRTTARGERGDWLVMTAWRTRDHAESAGGAPSGAGVEALAALVDATSAGTRRYFTLD
jgi:hypothetical protein